MIHGNKVYLKQLQLQALWYGNKVYLEQGDAAEIVENEHITLMHWGNVICKKINKSNGKVTSIDAELHLAGTTTTILLLL